MGEVNICPKGLGFKNIFRNFLLEKEKKKLIFLTTFYISHESCVKTFLNWFINNCLKGIINKTLKWLWASLQDPRF